MQLPLLDLGSPSIWSSCCSSRCMAFTARNLVSLYYRNKARRPRLTARYADLPGVTVQLPLFNEMYVMCPLATTRSRLPSRSKSANRQPNPKCVS